MNSLTVGESIELVVPTDPYHPTLNITLPYCSPLPNFNPSHSFFNYHKANYTRLCLFFSSFDWYFSFFNYDAESAFNIFYDALHKYILEFVPNCHFYKSTYPRWFTKEFKHLVYLKKKAHCRYKSSSLISDYKAFSILREKFKFESKKNYRKYVEGLKTLLKTNPKAFWRYDKNNRSINKIPIEMSLNNLSSTNEQTTANLFSSYFSSIFSVEQVYLFTDDMDIPAFDFPIMFFLLTISFVSC